MKEGLNRRDFLKDVVRGVATAGALNMVPSESGAAEKSPEQKQFSPERMEAIKRENDVIEKKTEEFNEALKKGDVALVQRLQNELKDHVNRALELLKN